MVTLLRCFLLCLLSECFIAFSLLNNQNYSIGNMSGGLVTSDMSDALENSNSFHQLLNQEALIRVALVQNVHSLMKDIMTVKNSMLVLETTLEKFKLATKKTIFQLEAEIEKLKSENQRLRNDYADKHRKLIPYDNETLQTVKDSISQMQKSFDTRLQMIEERKANVSSTEALETSLTKVSTEIERLQTIEAMKANVSSISALETSLTKVSSQLGRLQTIEAMKANVSSISALETSLTKVSSQLGRLQTIEAMKANVSSISALETSLTKVSSQLGRLQTIEAMKANVSSISALETSLTKVSSQLGNLSKRVAFTAGVTSHSSSWNSGTLVYDKVINNVGEGYNPNTGIFTAPVEGDYVFYVSIQSYSASSIFVDIVLNGSNKVRAMAHVTNPNDQYETGTNLVTFRLQQGDTVWVKHYSGQGYYTHSDAPDTTFSGFLI
ncbi:multimerin-2-like isoform X3 [Saccostrea cucullata]|uniref:multimerin-2-like isoform X3 n=1 Tax=Saccostrea cuccullata TaxID=36930 RepID=UPI002ED1DB01